MERGDELRKLTN